VCWFCMLAHHHRILSFDHRFDGRVPISQGDRDIPLQILKRRLVTRCPVGEANTDITEPF
jgi:hypothetical protein